MASSRWVSRSSDLRCGQSRPGRWGERARIGGAAQRNPALSTGMLKIPAGAGVASRPAVGRHRGRSRGYGGREAPSNHGASPAGVPSSDAEDPFRYQRRHHRRGRASHGGPRGGSGAGGLRDDGLRPQGGNGGDRPRIAATGTCPADELLAPLGGTGPPHGRGRLRRRGRGQPAPLGARRGGAGEGREPPGGRRGLPHDGTAQRQGAGDATGVQSPVQQGGPRRLRFGEPATPLDGARDAAATGPHHPQRRRSRAPAPKGRAGRGKRWGSRRTTTSLAAPSSTASTARVTPRPPLRSGRRRGERWGSRRTITSLAARRC